VRSGAHLRRWIRSIVRSADRSAAPNGPPRLNIDDKTWFELQFKPDEALQKFGLVLPTLPPDEVQQGFTGICGRPNLQQAFSFYQYVCVACRLADIREPRILDFGAGWGRIARFFLRDTKPEHLVATDCMSEAVRWLRATRNPCRIIKNEPRPPIEGLDEPIDLIYAFSVFSHLSEEYLNAWITYLMGRLRRGGYLVFTTRGRQFIAHLEKLHRWLRRRPPKNVREYQTRLREQLPPPKQVRRRYMNGEFQFYSIGGAGELTSDFFGEALIPRGYLERVYGSAMIDFTDQVPHVDQSVVVLRKPPAA